MTPSDLIDDLKSRINPAYAHQIGTESYERRLCVEALEALIAENDELRAEINYHKEDARKWAAAVKGCASNGERA